jgi:anthranilate synthase component I
VRDLMDVERYSHVMHIVSHVRAACAPGMDAYDLLRATFPAGTVSGAPKVRAMEIIEELEGERRSLYAGAIGYIGYDGSMDTCIAIRTMVMHGDTIYHPGRRRHRRRQRPHPRAPGMSEQSPRPGGRRRARRARRSYE